MRSATAYSAKPFRCEVPASYLGTRNSIAIEPDSLEQGQRLHRDLSVGGTDVQELSPAPWGGHYGSVVDQFGVRWMFNVPS